MSPNSLLSKTTRIYIAGHSGMVGSAIVRCLRSEGYANLCILTHAELDLTDQTAVRDFFQNERVDYVILSAAKVGGIHANSAYPAEFIYQNLMIESNVIHEACQAGVERLLFLGSSCIYPKLALQPLKEEYLLSDQLEPTNEPYAIAKIAGIKLCEAYNRQYQTKYRALMPTNLYGPNDNYDLEDSHVLPALIRKFHLAKLAVQKDWEAIDRDEAAYGSIPGYTSNHLKSIADLSDHQPASDRVAIKLWGSGTPRREFLYVDDLASACLLLMDLSDDQYDALCAPSIETRATPAKVSLVYPRQKVSHINVGSGTDLTIAELARMIKGVVGFSGAVIWDRTKPDGTPQKLLDISRLKRIGWRPTIKLIDGIRLTYTAYLKHSGQSD